MRRELRALRKHRQSPSAFSRMRAPICSCKTPICPLQREERGASSLRYIDESLQRPECDVLGMEHELRAALQWGQFEPYFQPLVCLEDRRQVGFEALVRWNHPSRGVLLPGEFLPVAEECGLIDAIDWQMYRNACEAGRALMGEGRYMTINVSPRHFQGNDLDTRLLEVTAASGFDPASLRVEVTEGTLLGTPSRSPISCCGCACGYRCGAG